METCGVKGTSRGLVTTYKTFTPNLYINYWKETENSHKRQDTSGYVSEGHVI